VSHASTSIADLGSAATSSWNTVVAKLAASGFLQVGGCGHVHVCVYTLYTCNFVRVHVRACVCVNLYRISC
jgi:hypothetical protein